MEVRLNPELQAKVDRWSADTGHTPEELIEEAVSAYVDELADVRATLDSRYDDLANGTVAAIDGEEAFQMLKRRNEELRKRSA